MKLLETAFRYVHRALTTDITPRMFDSEPAPALPRRVVAEDDGPCVVTLLSTAEQVVLDEDADVELAPAPPAVVEAEDDGPCVVTLQDAHPQVVIDEDQDADAAPEAAHDDFADLLSGLGAEPTAPAEVSPLEQKDREIAELQRNLQMLRPLGDELARVEQQRLAERAEFEARIAELEAAAAPAQTEPAVAPQDLRDVTRLLSALDTTLSDALSASETEAAPAPAAPEAPSASEEQLDKLRARLAGVREKLAEQKEKTARRRSEAQVLRARVKELDREKRALVAERKKVRTAVRELVRRSKRRTKPLERLIELLELDAD